MEILILRDSPSLLLFSFVLQPGAERVDNFLPILIPL